MGARLDDGVLDIYRPQFCIITRSGILGFTVELACLLLHSWPPEGKSC
jgi:hypothetical protein